MELSARNQLYGVVRAIHRDNVMSEVTIEVDPASVTAAITRASVERLKLMEGDRVLVIIKATEVIIGKE